MTYIEWIRNQPCLVCGESSDPHHVRIDGNAGTGIRPPDSYCIPLCFTHHRYYHDNGLGRFYIKLFDGDPTFYKEWIYRTMHRLLSAYMEEKNEDN